MYSSIDIANYFIGKSSKDGIGHLKLQKIVYISYGLYLAVMDKLLICDDKPEVWVNGPVFPKLFYSVKKNYIYRSSRHGINKRIPGEIRAIDDDTLSSLDAIWKEYSPCTGKTLRDLTHYRNTPWSMAKELAIEDSGADVPMSTIISDEFTKEYYTRILSERGKR